MSYSQLWLSRLLRAGFLLSFAHLGVLIVIKTLLGGGFNLAETGGGGSFTDYRVIKSLLNSQNGFILTLPLFQVISNTVFSHVTVWIFIASFIQSWVMGTFAEVSRIYPASRSETVFQVLGRRRSWTLSYIGLIGATSGIFCYCYMTGMGLGSVDVDPKLEGVESCPTMAGPSSICWNEQYRVLVSLSTLFGMAVFYIQYRELKFVMSYPTIHARPFERLRYIFFDAWADCWKHIVYFITFVVAILALKTFLFVASSVYLKNVMKFGIFFNLPFLINLALWPSFIVFSTKLCWRLVDITLTEMLKLPIESTRPNSTSIITLCDAMKSEEIPMKYLGFCEFNLLTCTPRTPSDIVQFFKLSHPGRHAKNWMGVLEATLNECSAMTKALNNYIRNCSRRGASVPIKLIPYSATLVPHSASVQNNLRRKTAQTHMRDLTAPVLPPVIQTSTPRNVLMLTPQIIKEALHRMLNHWYTKQIAPRITQAKSFAAEKDLHLDLANILSSGQLITWGTNAIVEISNASFVYDNYGIVQRDMHKIIAAMLNLYDALVDVAQITSPFNQTLPANSKVSDPLLRHLITAISFNLSRLHRSFSAYYGILGIPDEHYEKLEELSKLKQVIKITTSLRPSIYS